MHHSPAREMVLSIFIPDPKLDLRFMSMFGYFHILNYNAVCCIHSEAGRYFVFNSVVALF